jgi:hypothetical protein
VQSNLAVNLFVRWSRREEEGPMFQMIDDQKPTAEDRRMTWVKVGVFLVMVAALGGVVYFFAFVPWGK